MSKNQLGIVQMLDIYYIVLTTSDNKTFNIGCFQFLEDKYVLELFCPICQFVPKYFLEESDLLFLANAIKELNSSLLVNKKENTLT